MAEEIKDQYRCWMRTLLLLSTVNSSAFKQFSYQHVLLQVVFIKFTNYLAKAGRGTKWLQFLKLQLKTEFSCSSCTLAIEFVFIMVFYFPELCLEMKFIFFEIPHSRIPISQIRFVIFRPPLLLLLLHIIHNLNS